MLGIELFAVDYNNPEHAAALIELLDDYAQDEMGGARPLSDFTRTHLPQTLAQTSNAFSFIARVNGQPSGLVNCFSALSTFSCKPLVNIHDLTVKRMYRGLGISRALIQRVEAHAREMGCCKLTLEVLEGNRVARGVYQHLGFQGYALNNKTGHALFWEKPLT